MSLPQLHNQHNSQVPTASELNLRQFGGVEDAGSTNPSAPEAVQFFRKSDAEYAEEQMQRLPSLRAARFHRNISRAFSTGHRNLASPFGIDMRLPLFRCFGSWIDEASANSAETTMAPTQGDNHSLGWVPFRLSGDSSWLPEAEDAAFIDESIMNNSAAPFCTCEVPQSSHTVDGDAGLLCRGVQISVHPVKPRATREPRTSNPESIPQKPPVAQPTNFGSRSLQATEALVGSIPAFGFAPQRDLPSWIANGAALPLNAQFAFPLQLGGVSEEKSELELELEHENQVDVVLRLPRRVVRRWKDDRVIRILLHRVARGLSVCRRMQLPSICSPTSRFTFRLLPRCVVYDDTKLHSTLADVEAATGLSATGNWVSNALFGDRGRGSEATLGDVLAAPPRFLLIAGPRFSPYHQYHGVFAPNGVSWVAWMLDVGMKAARRRMPVHVRGRAMITRGYFTSHENCYDHHSPLTHALINMTTGWGEHYRMRQQLSTSLEAASLSVGGTGTADANTTDAAGEHDFVFLTHFAQIGDRFSGHPRLHRVIRSWGAQILAVAQSRFPAIMNDTRPFGVFALFRSKSLPEKDDQHEPVLYDWRPRIHDPSQHRIRGIPIDDERNILTMLERKGYGRYRNVSFGNSSSHSGTHSFEEQLDAIWSHSILVFAEGAFMTWMMVARPHTTFIMHFETTELRVDRSEPYLYPVLRFAFIVHLCSSANVRLIVYVRQAGVSPNLGTLAEALRRPFAAEMIIVRPGLDDGEPRRPAGDRTSVPSFDFPQSSLMHIASIENGRWRLLPTDDDSKQQERLTNGSVDLVPGLFSRGLPLN